MNYQKFKSTVFPVRHKLYRISLRLLEDAAEAEDAVQEIMAKLWDMRTRLPSYNSIDALAITMTRNYCLDRIKSRNVRRVNQTEIPAPDGEKSPQELLENTDQVRMIRKWIDELPEQLRLIIQLRDIEGLDTAEIGEIMEMNTGAVRTALSRARSRIREKMNILTSHESRRFT